MFPTRQEGRYKAILKLQIHAGGHLTHHSPAVTLVQVPENLLTRWVGDDPKQLARGQGHAGSALHLNKCGRLTS